MALDDEHNFTPDYTIAHESPDWFEFGHVTTENGKETITKKRSTDYGIFCDTPQPPPMGKIRYSRTAVPYRQDVIRNTNSRDDISYTLNCYTFQDGKDFRINKIYELVKDAERLYTSRYDGYYYKINEIDGITPKADANGLRINYSIKLSLDPYKYFGDDKEMELKSSSTKITVDGDMEAEPIITFMAKKGDVPELMGDLDFNGVVDSSDASILVAYAGYLAKKDRMDKLKTKIETDENYSKVKDVIGTWKTVEEYQTWWTQQWANASNSEHPENNPGNFYYEDMKEYIEWFNANGDEKLKKETELTQKQKDAADMNGDGKVGTDWYYHPPGNDRDDKAKQDHAKGKEYGYVIATPDSVKIMDAYAIAQTGGGNDYSVTSPRQASITVGGIKMTIGLPAHAINIGASVTLDVGQKRLYYVNEKGIKENILQYSLGDFPILYPGDNTVAWSGEISDVKIRWQERWI